MFGDVVGRAREFVPHAYMQLKGYSIVETLCIIIIFFISGLVLKTQEIVVALKHPGPLIYGMVAVLGITPCLGFACIRLPLSPPEFAIGAYALMALRCMLPCVARLFCLN